uniref:Uncharacterized protein n=1 Tax=Hordeum vulgare subsp. vulgare TaxID=112509 RepID=A0A8I6XZM3_HORVV
MSMMRMSRAVIFFLLVELLGCSFVLLLAATCFLLPAKLCVWLQMHCHDFACLHQVSSSVYYIKVSLPALQTGRQAELWRTMQHLCSI